MINPAFDFHYRELMTTKGSAIFRMIECAVTPDIFREALDSILG